jgi:uncharacterized membrane protein YccF (DUF307 family)
MSMLGNILWLIFGGLEAGLGYIIGGVIMCITIVGIPFGLPMINLGVAVFMPFGKRVVKLPSGSGCVQTVFNVLWLVTLGWVIALGHLIVGVIFSITIIGIPFGQQHFKLIPVALMPLSYKLE